MSSEPTNAQLIASAAAIAFASRRVIDGTDRTSVQDMGVACPYQVVRFQS